MDDPRAQRLAWTAFELGFQPWMRRRVHVRATGLPAPDDARLPLVLAANHVSWWDGFVLREIQRALRPRAPFWPVMLERELARRPFFRALGAVGIDAASPATIRRAMRTLERRRAARPDGVIAYFPQGRMWPTSRRPLGFRRGIELVASRLAPVRVLPVALHVEPLNTPAPTVFVLGGTPVHVSADDARSLDHTRLEAEVEKLLDVLHRFLSRHGERSLALFPGLHAPLSDARGATTPALQTID